MPVADDQNTLRVGERGPSLLEDFHFREKIFHFDHERIPERVVHARGFGAHGYFEPYESLADVTRADLFQRPGERTPVFVRFSTVAGNKGSFDLARDVRGFAVKFYTQEGNWDLVGNNIPVFFIQDAIKFPDLVHSVKQEPDRGFPQAQSAHDNFWDFISLMPESTHMVMWTMSDRAIPRSFRFMEGFGVHTFRFVNAAGESTFVKFHWKPKLGLQSVVWNEAVKINGADPDFHRRDLWDAINGGDFPEWELGVQLFDDDFADEFDFDILDATKIIPEELVPGAAGRAAGARPHGRQLLRRDRAGGVLHPERRPRHRLHQRPAAAGPQLLLPRHPAQAPRRARTSPTCRSTPRSARSPTSNRTGTWRSSTRSGRVNYEPNSWSGEAGGPREDPAGGFTSFAEDRRGRASSGSAPSASPTTTARPASSTSARRPIEQDHIVDAFVFELSKCEQPGIRARMVANLRNVDEDFAHRVADGLRLDPLPGRLDAGPAADHRPAAVAGAEHRRQRPRDASPAARSACSSPTAPTPRSSTALRKAASAEGALVELDRPADRRRRD